MMTTNESRDMNLNLLFEKACDHRLEAWEERQLSFICQSFDLPLLALATLGEQKLQELSVAAEAQVWRLELLEKGGNFAAYRAHGGAEGTFEFRTEASEGVAGGLTMRGLPTGISVLGLWAGESPIQSLETPVQEFILELPDNLRASEPVESGELARGDHLAPRDFTLAAEDEDRRKARTEVIADMGVVVEPFGTWPRRLACQLISKSSLQGTLAVEMRFFGSDRQPVEARDRRTGEWYRPPTRFISLEPNRPAHPSREVQRVVAALGDPAFHYATWEWEIPFPLPMARYVGLRVRPLTSQEALTSSKHLTPVTTARIQGDEWRVDTPKAHMGLSPEPVPCSYIFLVTAGQVEGRVDELIGRAWEQGNALNFSKEEDVDALANMTMAIYSGKDSKLLDKPLRHDTDATVSGARRNSERQITRQLKTHFGLASDKHARRVKSVDDGAEPASRRDEMEEAERRLDSQTIVEAFQRILREESKKDREIQFCELRVLEGKAYKELEAMTGIPWRSIQGIVRRRMQRIRKRLEEEGFGS